jgi:hypothetical protein
MDSFKPEELLEWNAVDARPGGLEEAQHGVV